MLLYYAAMLISMCPVVSCYTVAKSVFSSCFLTLPFGWSQKICIYFSHGPSLLCLCVWIYSWLQVGPTGDLGGGGLGSLQSLHLPGPKMAYSDLMRALTENRINTLWWVVGGEEDHPRKSELQGHVSVPAWFLSFPSACLII